MKKIIGSVICSAVLVGCEGTPTYEGDVAYYDGNNQPVYVSSGTPSNPVYINSNGTQRFPYPSSNAQVWHQTIYSYNGSTNSYYHYSIDITGNNQTVNIYADPNNLNGTYYIDEIYINGDNNTLVLPNNVVVNNYVYIKGVGQGNRVSFGNNAQINYIEVLQDSNDVKIGYNSTVLNNRTLYLYDQNHRICLPSSVRVTYMNGSQNNHNQLYSLGNCPF